MKIKVVIVDDEPLARERLADLVAEEADLELAAECATGAEAVAAIQQQRPELVFLDVQMPELDGFGVLAQIEPERRPVVVFATAYDRFALKAFEVHAVDYLLKPFDQERFQAALRRARTQIQHRETGELSRRLSALLADLKPEAPAVERLAVKTGGRVVFVKTDEIDWVEAADNYVELHAGSATHLYRETLTALAGQLPARKFIRISRSVIVNIDRIKELQPLFHGEYAVFLRDGTKLTLSRGYREALQQLLGKDF